MSWRFLAIALIAIIATSVAGCRVITAPVRYVFHSPEPTPAPNQSDVTNPGRPLPVPSPTATPRAASRKATQQSAHATPKPATSKPSPSALSAAQFPVAKPVPGKPGLVFNPFKANGGYIDVSGYAPGSKVKDPETQKIFTVP
jgi:hypothetical protein